MEFILGDDCRVYYGAGLTELDITREASVNCERPEVDGTKRNSANRIVKGGKKVIDAEVVVLYEPGDPGFVALRDAYLTNVPLALDFLTGEKTDASAEGPSGEWSILKMSRPEPLDQEVVVTFSAKPAGDITWKTTGSGS